MRRLIPGFVLATLGHAANAGCLPILGTVELTPDASCQVTNYFPLKHLLQAGFFRDQVLRPVFPWT